MLPPHGGALNANGQTELTNPLFDEGVSGMSLGAGAGAAVNNPFAAPAAPLSSPGGASSPFTTAADAPSSSPASTNPFLSVAPLPQPPGQPPNLL
jgi:hypothetical protein